MANRHRHRSDLGNTKARSLRSRAWCFTDFDIDKYDEDFTANLSHISSYLVLGKEQCPQTQRMHIQGYIRFANARSFQAMTKLLVGAHLEPARGSPESNREYCLKESCVVESGTFPRQGHRSDLEGIFLFGKELKSFDSLVDEFGPLAFKWDNYYWKVFSYFKAKNTIFTQKYVLVLWGETGTGKTRYVYENYGNDLYTSFDYKWFDGYKGQNTVLFDEFMGSDKLCAWFLRLTDGYPISVQVKGGSVPFFPKNIIFTTNLDPNKDWFVEAIPRVKEAIFRRITEIKYLVK